jgi:hypothetical protein
MKGTDETHRPSFPATTGRRLTLVPAIAIE